jgi:hypothetical protein
MRVEVFSTYNVIIIDIINLNNGKYSNLPKKNNLNAAIYYSILKIRFKSLKTNVKGIVDSANYDLAI